MKYLLLVLPFIICSVASGQSAFAKAENLYKQCNYKAALPIYTELLQADANNVKLLRATGQTYGKLDKFEEATGVYERLLSLDNNNAEYHFFYGGAMGMWAKNAGKFKALSLLDDVKFHLKRAAELDSRHVEVRWALVQLYTELPGIIGGSLSTARKYASQLQTISPVDGYLATGYIEEYDKDYEDAETAYKKAIKVGGSPLTYLKLASLYSDKMNREGDAKTTLKEGLKIHKDSQLRAELKKLDS